MQGGPLELKCLEPLTRLTGVDQHCLHRPEYPHPDARPVSAQAANCNCGKKQNSASCSPLFFLDCRDVFLYHLAEHILKDANYTCPNSLFIISIVITVYIKQTHLPENLDVAKG